MVAISRESFNKALEGYTCQRIVHPNDTRCTVGLLKLVGTVLKGSAKYFFLMYLAQNAIRYKSLSKADIRPILVSYTRSLACGVWTICSCTAVICFSRQWAGSFHRDVLGYVAGAVGGLGIYIDDPARRSLVATTLSAMAIETLLRRLYKKIKRRKSLETLGFMILNAILMYKMRVPGLRSHKSDLWFFRPPRMKKDKKTEEKVDCETGETLTNVCAHAEKACRAIQCYENVIQGTTKYFIGGLLFSTIKLLSTKPDLLRNPLSFLKAFSRWNNMRLACSLGWYVGVYKAITCCLCRWTKQDKAEFGLIAGFISGLSYGLNQNLAILGSIILYVSRIFGREFQEKYQLYRFPFLELSHVMAVITLHNTRLFDPDSCPGGLKFIMDVIAERKLDGMYDKVLECMVKQTSNNTSLFEC